jgi:hypothetical protein
MYRPLIAGAVFLCLFAPLVAANAQDSAPALVVTSCKISAGDGFRETMLIGFRNTSSTALAKIVWRGAYGSGWIDFTDIGTFNPGEEIYHRLNDPFRTKPIIWSFYNREGLGGCRPVETEDANGHIWRDETVSHDDPRHFPPPPNDHNTPLPASYPNADNDPVGIVGCTVRFHRDRTTAFGLVNVRFRNLSQSALKEITFRAFYPGGGFYVAVSGTYSPSALINVAFDMQTQLANHARYEKIAPGPYTIDYHSVDEAQNCIATKARFADDTIWTYPNGIPAPPAFLQLSQ